MPGERFDFPNASGQTLAALLDSPAGELRVELLQPALAPPVRQRLVQRAHVNSPDCP